MKTSIALISEPDNREFTEFTAWLRLKCGLQTDQCFTDIPTAISQSQADAVPSELTIVLQSWSDQYVPADIDQLIGATLYTELICVYGTWCEGDGRSRPVWPHATRVPLRFAPSIVLSTIKRIRSGRPSLPATASRDEAFLRRQPEVPDTTAASRGTALVISPDRVLRQTWADLLKLCGWDSADTSPECVRRLASGRFDMIVHDLDPGDTRTRKSLSQCRSSFRNSRFVGIASIPGDISHATDLSTPPVVLSKMDPLRSIERLMRDAA